MKREYFWKAKGLQLEGKSGLFARKCKFFEKQKIACRRQHYHNSLYISDITQTAQNSRISRQRFICAFNSQF